MQYFALISSFLEAMAAIPKIGSMVEGWVAAAALWLVQRQKEANRAAIIDALHKGMKAQTQEERFEAAKNWQETLSRGRPK